LRLAQAPLISLLKTVKAGNIKPGLKMHNLIFTFYAIVGDRQGKIILSNIFWELYFPEINFGSRNLILKKKKG